MTESEVRRRFGMSREEMAFKIMRELIRKDFDLLHKDKDRFQLISDRNYQSAASNDVLANLSFKLADSMIEESENPLQD